MIIENDNNKTVCLFKILKIEYLNHKLIYIYLLNLIFNSI
jgi:hypothetical protein